VDKPIISIIICAYTVERLKDICEAVESVLVQTLRPHEVIIAVDHNKQLYERLAELYPNSAQPRRDPINLNQSPVSSPQSPISNLQSLVPVVLALNGGAQGLSETRNVGIRASSGDIVAFIDDDAVAEKDWLLYLTKPFEDERVVAVTGRAIPLWTNGKRPSWFPEELDWVVGCTYKGLPLNRNAVRNVLGCNMAFRRSVFEKVGFFRSETGRVGATIGCGEESDLCLQISRALSDALIVYEGQATIHHKVTPQRTTWQHLWRRSYNEGFYKAKVQKLHQPTQQTLSTQQTQRTLSTEDSYLRYLLFRSIPGGLARFYRRGDLPQIAAIIVCIAATGVGYLAGRIRV
jgi:glycosyltransferase involved in cell wall biosynthesis